MKQHISLVITIILALTLLLSGCGDSAGTSNNTPQAGTPAPPPSDGETIVMRLAHTNPESDPKQLEAELFAQLVEEKTGGKVKIEVYGGAVLGDARELLEGLSLGTCEIVIEGFGTLEAYTNLSTLDPIPFVYRDYDHFMNVWNSELGEEIMDEAGLDANMKMFGPSYRGMRVVTSTKRFETVEELRGLKLRCPAIDIYIKTWQTLGASPTPMAMTEILTGIQQGTVEGQENPIIMSYSFGFYDVCGYLIKTDHVSSADMFMMDAGYFKSLPEDVQQALLDAGIEAGNYISEYIKENEMEYLEKWEEQGVEIVYPQIDGFVEALDGFIEREYPYLSDYVTRISEMQ